MNRHYFVTGIGTDVGKTVASAILAQALGAHYIKPIQAGDLDNSDSIKIGNLCDDSVTILPEIFKLTSPMSPHAAAKIDGVEITLEKLTIKRPNANLIIEGAGGIMVPLNSNGLLLIDYIENIQLPVIIVSRHYLGSINHTLLTIEILKNRNIIIEGIVFIGDENKETESIILQKTNVKMIGRIPIATELNKKFIVEQALKLQESWN